MIVSNESKSSRRDFFRGGWLRGLRENRNPQDSPETEKPSPRPRTIPPFLRPPGALEEQSFLATCDRSGHCVEACHQDSILPLTFRFGKELKSTPAVIPEIRACFVCDDVPCARACPSGALQPIPVEELKLGTAILDQSRCIVPKGEACSACIDSCPMPGEAIFSTSASMAPIINPTQCNGCGLCVSACPVEPSVIRIHPSWAIQV